MSEVAILEEESSLFMNYPRTVRRLRRRAKKLRKALSIVTTAAAQPTEKLESILWDNPCSPSTL
jgi:hypothetical protein